MSSPNISTDEKIITALDYVSGTADRNGATVDMANWETLIVIFKMATIASSAVQTIKFQQDSASGMGTAADLLGTSVAIADDDDDQIFWIEITKPRERYVRAVIDKDGSNACAESAIYILRGLKKLPVDNVVDDTITGELHVSPAEGTA